jgi:WD40 repeat protein
MDNKRFFLIIALFFYTTGFAAEVERPAVPEDPDIFDAPDGKLSAVTKLHIFDKGTERNIFIYDKEKSDKPIYIIETEAPGVFCVEWSPEPPYKLIVFLENGNIIIFHPETKTIVPFNSLKRNSEEYVAWGPENKSFARCEEKKKKKDLHIYDTHGGALIERFPLPSVVQGDPVEWNHLHNCIVFDQIQFDCSHNITFFNLTEKKPTLSLNIRDQSEEEYYKLLFNPNPTKPLVAILHKKFVVLSKIGLWVVSLEVYNFLTGERLFEKAPYTKYLWTPKKEKKEVNWSPCGTVLSLSIDDTTVELLHTSEKCAAAARATEE